MKQVRVYISGFVQGVGFRQFVRNGAVKAGVTGWVRNVPDGRVEAVFQGEENAIDKVVEISKHGPFLSEVEDVTVLPEPSKELFTSFAILR